MKKDSFDTEAQVKSHKSGKVLVAGLASTVAIAGGLVLGGDVVSAEINKENTTMVLS